MIICMARRGDDWLYGGKDHDWLYGGRGDDTLWGGKGDDGLIGDDNDDTLYGGDGQDWLNGGADDDTLEGGKGFDRVYGGSGDDTYIYAKGDGNDAINNYDTSANNQDTLRFLAGINADDIKVSRSGFDLELTMTGGEVITIRNFFYSSDWELQRVQFANGDSAWYTDTLKRLVHASYGTQGADTLNGDNSDNILRGLSGNDTLNGNGGNDTLYGGSGDDRLYGGDNDDHLYGGNNDDMLDGGTGNDYLVGGKGDDTLRGGKGDYDYMTGGEGDDTFIFAKGDGYLDISSYDTGAGRNDVLRLQGINQNDVKVNRISGIYRNSLQLTIKSTGEIINITGFFKGSSYELQQVIFADGSTWDTAELKRRATANGIQDTLTGTDSNDTLYGGAGDNTLTGGKGKDTLKGWWGDDTLNGGKGDDYLEGGTGNDTYLYAKGDGNDTIYNYGKGKDQQDTLSFTDLNANEVTAGRRGDNLLLTIDDGSTLTIKDHFKGSDYALQRIEFADGITWTLANLRLGTSGADTLNGTGSNDVIVGLSGNDTLNGDGDNDILYGGSGNDSLYGGANDDTLIGGKDNDILTGGAGNDVYLYAKGDGNDMIDNDDTGSNKQDTLRFTDLNANEVTAVKSGDNLLLTIDDGGIIMINNHFKGSRYALQQVEFADGITWTLANLQWGTSSADTLSGTVNNDVIFGLGGKDTLNGGGGNDILYGGKGDDTYLYAKGDGNDTIDNYATSSNNQDTLRFTDLNSDDVKVSKSSNNLLLTIDDGSIITIKDFFKGSDYELQKVEFADGITWALANLRLGTDSANTLNGTTNNDVIFGLGGNDTLYGSGGNDILYGGTGDDTLQGGRGDDTLRGGKGDYDYMTGGRGDDTFIFAVGDGYLDISSYDTGVGRNDVLRLERINQNDVKVNRISGKYSNDLQLTIKSSGEIINISGFFKGSRYEIQEVIFTDGTWNTAELKRRATANGVQDTLTGTDSDDTLRGGAGDNTLNGGKGKDTLKGWWGNDTLYGGEGNDTLYGGRGDDTLYGNDHNDTLYGGERG